MLVVGGSKGGIIVVVAVVVVVGIMLWEGKKVRLCREIWYVCSVRFHSIVDKKWVIIMTGEIEKEAK